MRQFIGSADHFLKVFFQEAKKVHFIVCFYYFSKIHFFRKIKLKKKEENYAHFVPLFIGPKVK